MQGVECSAQGLTHCRPWQGLGVGCGVAVILLLMRAEAESS